MVSGEHVVSDLCKLLWPSITHSTTHEQVDVCDDGTADDGSDGTDGLATKSSIRTNTSLPAGRSDTKEPTTTTVGSDDAVLDELLSMGTAASSSVLVADSNAQPEQQDQVATEGGDDEEEGDDLEDWLDDVLG
jgi:hypothetical protein